MTWFVQIVLAIEFMHNQRTIHRDIKSENILLDKNGMIKLADFGTAKRFKTANLAQTQRAKGTPLYMCPEMFQEFTYDFPADVWSLGVLLYYMCCLKYPFYPKDNTNAYISLKNQVLTAEDQPLPA